MSERQRDRQVTQSLFWLSCDYENCKCRTPDYGRANQAQVWAEMHGWVLDEATGKHYCHFHREKP